MGQEKLQGGALGGVDELYREVILDHFKSPKNKGKAENANATSEGMNPLCGDQITVTARIENGKIGEIKFDGHGCAISQAAASMMTLVVKNRTPKEVEEMAVALKKLFGVEEAKNKATPFNIDHLGDTVALEGVKKYPVRIKCALLSWNTLLDSLKSIKGESHD